MSDEEWGPWIDHDGKGCPVPIGTIVNVVRKNNSRDVYMVGRRVTRSGKETRITELRPINNTWIHGSGRTKWTLRREILKYRVKKPKGLTILEELLQKVDDKKILDQPLEIF